MIILFQILYGGSAGLYILAFCLHLLKRRSGERAAGFAGLVCNLMALVSLYLDKGRLPIFEIFDVLLVVTFVLAGLVGIRRETGHTLPDIAFWAWLTVLLIMGSTLFFVFIPPHMNRIDVDYPFMLLFHGARVLGLAFILFASCHYIQYLVERNSPQIRGGTIHMGRNYAFLSVLLFLLAEYAGMIWCLEGWADVWHWSGGFFMSTAIVLYLVLILHLPAARRGYEKARGVIGGASGYLIAALMIIRHTT